MKYTRIILAGGFLGAGKTTLIWNVAQRLIAKGLKVGLITNDQAPELVDSRLLKHSDLQVAEVAGSCFCCNFNGFTQAIKDLRSDVDADVILAEPVGSCADLSATIVNPLKKFYQRELVVSPMTVLADPARLNDILFGGNGGLHEDAAYIYRKQLEESDVILITKIDTLTPEQTDRLMKMTRQAFPTSIVMTASSHTGIGVVEWVEAVSNSSAAGLKLLDIDYDKYAHGEAVLGWLNGTLRVKAAGTDWDAKLGDIMHRLGSAIDAEQLRVGHVKVIAECGDRYAVGNITGSVDTLQLRGNAGCSDEARLIVNARVETTPEHIDALIRNVLAAALDGCEYEIEAWRYLQPGRPNPTHRFQAVEP